MFCTDRIRCLTARIASEGESMGDRFGIPSQQFSNTRPAAGWGSHLLAVKQSARPEELEDCMGQSTVSIKMTLESV